MKELKQKHHHFIAEYLRTDNGTQSAITAGFAVKSAAQSASRLLKDDKVKEEIARLNERVKAKVVDSVAIDKAWVLNSAVEVFQRCMQQIPVTERKNGKTVCTGEYRFDVSGANKALDTIGKHKDIAAFDTTVKHIGDEDNPIAHSLGATERAARVAEILEKALLAADKDNS